MESAMRSCFLLDPPHSPFSSPTGLRFRGGVTARRDGMELFSGGVPPALAGEEYRPGVGAALTGRRPPDRSDSGSAAALAAALGGARQGLALLADGRFRSLLAAGADVGGQFQA